MSKQDKPTKRKSAQMGQGHIQNVRANEAHAHERYDRVTQHAQKVEQAAGPYRKQTAPHHADGISIFIDNKPFRVKDARISLADLRKITDPPISADNDVFHVVPGMGKVKLNETDFIDVNLQEREQGRHFVTALRKDSKLLTHQQISERAHQLFSARGCTHGKDVEDWLLAESQLMHVSKD